MVETVSDRPSESMSEELRKNDQRTRRYENTGLAIGTGIGLASSAAGGRLRGWDTVMHVMNTGFTGWLMGLVLGRWKEQHHNQTAAMLVDNKMGELQQENAVLKDQVQQLGTHIISQIEQQGHSGRIVQQRHEASLEVSPLKF